MSDMDNKTVMDEDAIRDLVKRLARPHPSGGTVIERAAIFAEGSDSEVVIAWIMDHAGQPEAEVATTRAGGLHGSRLSGGGAGTGAPRRFVLPAGALN